MSSDFDMLVRLLHSVGSYAQGRPTGVSPPHLQRDMTGPVPATPEATRQIAEAATCVRVPGNLRPARRRCCWRQPDFEVARETTKHNRTQQTLRLPYR